MQQLKCSPSKRVNREYPILVGTNILEENLPKFLKSYEPDKVVIITDTNVEKLYGEKIISLVDKYFETHLVAMPAGEKNKTPEIYLDLCDQVLAKKITKKSFILLLGGGVPGNVGGFVASTVMRGIKFGHLPTTIIAQADSTSGGKQGVNTKRGKNLLGLFNDPEFVLVDTIFLKTLPKREIKCGLAECVKHALCQDKDFVNYLAQVLNPEAEYSAEVMQEILFRTLQAKLEVLRYDPKEVNEGKVLVYGHTVGHVIETIGDYKLNHGEAISIGMMFAAYAAKELGFADEEMVKSHRELLAKTGLPLDFPEYVNEENLLEQLRYDKKYTTEMELILLNKVGELQHVDGRIGHTTNEDFVRTVVKKYFLNN